jgi:hypothetical protein
MAKPLEHEIGRAAAWWATYLRVPAGSVMSGDILNDTFMNSSRKRMREPVSEEEIERFRQALVDVLSESVTDEDDELFLTTDYVAEDLLRDAADRSRLAARQIDSNFPIKTRMWIKRGNVEVVVGYGSPTRQIFNDGSGGSL